MQVPEEVLDKGLTPRQYFLLAHLYRNVDRWGEVHLTSEELEQLTNTSRTTVWRDMTALEDAKLVETYRTRRDFNKFSKNRYTLIAPCFTTETEPCFQPETSDEKTVSLCFPPETSTTDYVDSNKLLTTVTTLESNTSYLIYNDAAGVVLEKKKPKREKKKMVNKWQDDDDIGGFGLLEGEVPASQRQRPLSKRDPKTRHNRPQHEWTSQDVASEFASRMYDKVRGIPGLVNVQKLTPVLAKYRKEYGLTPIMELEVLDMLMGDDRKLVGVKKDPVNAYKIFLKMLATHNQKAIRHLGLENLDETPTAQYVYASDGKRFDNSMPGRKAMKNYEQKLGATT